MFRKRKGCSLTVEHEANTVREVSYETQEQCAGIFGRGRAATPGGTAVVDEFGSYTYKQLQDDSAAYGAALAKYDVANRGVVIMVEKATTRLPSCWDVVCIRVLRAG